MTSEELQAYLKTRCERHSGRLCKLQAKRIHCVDGTTLSVQASKSHYCSPRTNKSPYYEVEVGFPDVEPPETWLPFQEVWDENKKSSSDSIYTYIPLHLVLDYINEHGGITGEHKMKEIKVRTSRGGKHTKATFWMGVANYTLANCGTLTFEHEEWQAFLTKLMPTKDESNLLNQAISLLDRVIEDTYEEEETCSTCYAHKGTPHDDTCPWKEYQEVSAALTALLVRRETPVSVDA